MTTEHPDDELLSALLDAGRFPADGQPAPDLTDHVAGCEMCQQRLARLAEVVAAVAAPVTPPPEAVRETAISRALATQASHDETSVSAPVVRIDRRLAARRGWRPARALGAAAVALALLGAIPLLYGSESNKSATTASRAVSGTVDAAAQAATTTDPAAGGAYRAPTSGPRALDSAVPELGPQSDPVQVAHQIDQAFAAAAAKGAAVPSPATSPAQSASPSLSTAAVPCEPAAAAAVGATVPAAYAASLTWKGTPAEVYAFMTPSGRQAVVISRTDCRVLQILPL